MNPKAHKQLCNSSVSEIHYGCCAALLSLSQQKGWDYSAFSLLFVGVQPLWLVKLFVGQVRDRFLVFMA